MLAFSPHMNSRGLPARQSHPDTLLDPSQATRGTQGSPLCSSGFISSSCHPGQMEGLTALCLPAHALKASRTASPGTCLPEPSPTQTQALSPFRC